MNEIGNRIRDLREYRDMTKRELASRLGISESQLSRIESGKTVTLSSDILIGLAGEFDVSSDYILGLSPTKSNSHILSDLRLSETACEKLIRREVDGETLSRLMEQDRFGDMIKLSRAYFTDIYAEGVSYRNATLNFGASFLRDHAEETEHPDAVRSKANDILQARTRDHELELTQIQTLMRRILAEAKTQYERESTEQDPALKRRIAGQAFSAWLREIAEEVNAAQETEEEKLDRVTDRVLEEAQAANGLPDWTARLLKPIYKRIIRSAGKAKQAEAEESSVKGAK